MTIASTYIVGYAIIIVFEFKGVLMNKKEKSKIIFLSGLITLLVILCIYALNGFAPFGTKTLAIRGCKYSVY